MSDKKILIGIAGLLGLTYLFTRKAKAEPTEPSEGILDIVSCPTTVGVSNESASISINVKALYDNVSKILKIVAGSFTDSKLVTLNKDQTSTITFIVPNVTQNTNYTVSVI